MLSILSKLLALVPKRTRHYAKAAGTFFYGLSWYIKGYVQGQRYRNRESMDGSKESMSVSLEEVDMNPLQSYFDAHVKGPGLWKWRHYLDIYDRYFSKFVGKEVHILEIGVYSGGSLNMWKHYLGPNCKVYGVDVVPECASYESADIRVFIADQANREFWRSFRKEVPRLDIVIDDGGHHPNQQMVTLEELLPHISRGGIYLCEDIYNDYNPFQTYLNALAMSLNAFHKSPNPETLSATTNSLQRWVKAIHQYPFLVVIEKSDWPAADLLAPKRGDQWQPFPASFSFRARSERNPFSRVAG